MGINVNGLLREAAYRVASLLLGTIVLPFWLLIALAVFLGVPAWSGAVFFWLNTAKTTSTFAATLAPIITYPYFPGILALIGLAYLIVVAFPGSNVVRHKIVPIVGWLAVFLCFVAVIATACIGYFELRVREEANKIALGIPRDTPDYNSPKRPQTPLFGQDSNRYPTPDQTRILILQLSSLKGSLKLFPISWTDGDYETNTLRLQYADILRRAGIPILNMAEEPSGPDDVGILFQVRDPNNISDSAQKVLEALAIANVFPTLKKLPPTVNLDQGSDFVLFIAPRPIQWH